MIDTQDPLREPRREAFLNGACERLLSDRTNVSSGVLRCVRDAAMELRKNSAAFFFWREEEAFSCQRFQTNHSCSIQTVLS